MILYHGEILNNSLQDKIIASLGDELNNTLAKGYFPSPFEVLEAIEVIYQEVINHKYDNIILPLLKQYDIPESMFLHYASLFSPESLKRKIEIELGDYLNLPSKLDNSTIRERYPLGVLFHIAAGNVDGLPSYSVIEGLLSGNINLLKLPSGDNGLSIMILKRLIDVNPRLKDFIYVFDVPSTEVSSIKKLADLSDAIAVWGGDLVNKAVREFADVKTKIISWGHKVSFAYVDNYVSDEELKALMHALASSEQLLCSSVQGIYLDTDSLDELYAFAKRCFDIISKENLKLKPSPAAAKGKNALLFYNEILERKSAKGLYLDNGVSVIVKEDYELEASWQFRNLWIKRLPHEKIVFVLKKNHDHLQSVGVSVKKENIALIQNLLAQAGLSRITKLDQTSRMIIGEAHDGVYPLKVYSRIVEKDISDL